MLFIPMRHALRGRAALLDVSGVSAGEVTTEVDEVCLRGNQVIAAQPARDNGDAELDSAFEDEVAVKFIKMGAFCEADFAARLL